MITIYKKRSYIIIFLIVFCLSIIGYFYICTSDLIALTSTQTLIPIPKDTLDKIIKENVQPISIKPSFGGKPFCDYKIVSYEKNNNIVNLYLLLLGQEYYIDKNNKLVSGSGGEFTAVLTIEKENNSYKFVNCNISRAEEEELSLQIFPKSIRKKVSQLSPIGNNAVKKDAEAYFGKKLSTDY